MGNSAHAFIMSFGGLGILILAIGDSSFVSVPEANDVLIVLLSAGASWGHMIYFVGLTIIGSVIGCMLLYSLGRRGGSPILQRKFSQKNVERAEKLFKRYGILSVVLASILPPPTPFKVFVLGAGVFRLSARAFFTAVLIGRTIRYSLWGIIAVLYGDSAKLYVRENLHTIGRMLFAGLVLTLIGGFVFYIYRRKKNRSNES